MKNLLILSVVALSFAFAFSAHAAVPNWDISGDWVLDFAGGSANREFRNMTQDGDGNVIGEFWWINGSTWECGGTLVGSVSGNDLYLYYDRAPIIYTGEFWGTITNSGISGTFKASSGFEGSWYTVSGTATFNRYAEITSPAAGETVEGILNLGAYLMDDDYDAVQWAVRQGTCAVATNNIIGNVDGMNDPFTWGVDGGILYKYNFSASADVTAWVEGIYCFIFNPSEDAGEPGIRETEFFLINNSDSDGDGVEDYEDLCLGTEFDSPTEDLGVNRHIWDGDGDGYFTTLVPAGKGEKVEESSPFSLADTYGCSCEQILDRMKETTGGEFGGHYKFGCSKSLIQDWIAGTYHIGPTWIETVEVPANDADGVESSAVLETGKDYFLKAYGTGMACNQASCMITFDAEYSTSDGTTWVDGVAAPYDSYGPDLLDLKVDGGFVDWGTYNSEHTYQIPYAGTGNVLGLLIYDLAGSYFNDTGSLFVDIIEDKWVDLW